jgi:hypothetical protein
MTSKMLFYHQISILFFKVAMLNLHAFDNLRVAM